MTPAAPAPVGSPRPSSPSSRTLRRRRTLPGGRAVVGGFLIAVAAVGTFAAYTSATADTRVAYLAASHDLSIGHRITTADLAYARSTLPSFAAARAFRRPAELVGS